METLRNRKNKTRLKQNENYNERKVENLNFGDITNSVTNFDNGEVEKNKQFTQDTSHITSVSCSQKRNHFRFSFAVDFLSLSLFICGMLTRMYKLREPKNIVFDELHYGKFISLYMKNTFFFDTHPPLGKQLVAAVAHLAGYDGSYKFDKIGSSYSDEVPLFALRFIPALFGSLILPTTYHLMMEMGFTQWTSLLAALLFLLDNSLLTQSRFILMEPILLFFALFGLLCLLKFQKHSKNPYNVFWFSWIILGSASLSCAMSIKYVGFYSCCLGAAILIKDFWKLLPSPKLTDASLFLRFSIQALLVTAISTAVYLGIFYVHLNILYKAGPHDSIMTSAFQASLEGGLASITKGQPLLVAHGSQITLRHTHGRTCWLHSHNAVYPIRYPDKRGSSHQQQVTCYSFKDVNNWWIVKRPERNDLVVGESIDPIKDGEVVQLIHGITSRALNSHDVAAPVSPQNQEVSCYIDYNISMPAQNWWRVEIINKEQNGDTWHTIQSLVRLIHVESNTALKFTGRQLPDWGFNQHEVATDRIVNQDDAIWNVEEHRYTKSDDQKQREIDLVSAEMIPTTATKLSFWEKLYELHYKMMFVSADSVQNHMYSSEPLDWPFLSRGIAYWVSSSSNAQVHLLGNIIIWYSASLSLVLYSSLLIFYLLRRRRLCYDLDERNWSQFKVIGEIFLTGYLFHYIPYFFIERTLFLHHYLPAFVFKTLLLAATLEHIYVVLNDILKKKVLSNLFIFALLIWLGTIFFVFQKFSVLSYGTTALTTNDILDLRWKDTWDFIVHKS